jgi:L-lactate dehydrogenase
MESDKLNLTRIAIVGAGFVGATFAYSLMLSGLASEIVLIDSNIEKAMGEAMDINHAVPFGHPTQIWAGSYADCAGAAVTVITAGVNQKPGETRLDLITHNTTIFRQIVPQIIRFNPEGLLLVATNPVDVLSYVTWKLSGLPAAKVIGSGTILDTARFRYLLSKYFGVDTRSVHAYIIGEHGDSEVPVWSLSNIAGMKLSDFCDAHQVGCSEEKRNKIFLETREAAYEIIKRKGATYFAIASGLTRILEAILRDQNTVLTVSSLIQNAYGIDDVFLSIPAIIDAGGVERILHLNLDENESQGLLRCAQLLRNVIDQIYPL